MHRWVETSAKFIAHLQIIDCPCAPNLPVAACCRRDDEFMLYGPSSTGQKSKELGCRPRETGLGQETRKPHSMVFLYQGFACS